ncbi:hypothetical protein JW824_13620 [bacterium]|nr:hypothetical protein [bacterium]
MRKPYQKIKAILLLSGGLDSILAAHLMKNQQVEVLALNFVTPFCSYNRNDCQSLSKEAAEKLDISIRFITLDNEYIQLIKHPKHGYGKNLNPCIDCRIYMLSKARTIMENEGARFIITGEVLGERPMSQRHWAMKMIEKGAGLEGLILRPLSAKCMKPTQPEVKGWIDRDKLLGIQGRNRKPQIKLAKEHGIKDYLCPSGGCLLTDAHFAKRLKDSLRYGEEQLNDIHLLKIGRHYRLESGAKIIVGRNKNENQVIEDRAPYNGLLMKMADEIKSPTTLLNRYDNSDDIDLAGALTLRYSNDVSDEGKIQIWSKSRNGIEFRSVKKRKDGELVQYRI